MDGWVRFGTLLKFSLSDNDLNILRNIMRTDIG